MIGDVIYEFIAIGNYIKVTAVDVNSGTEAVVLTPQNISQQERQKLAYKKLLYVMTKSEKS